MTTLSPSKAAQLADEVYAVQRESEFRFFLDNPLFKKTGKAASSPHKYLKSEVGGRVILNFEDGFGVCADGGDNNVGEIFLIFRGTTKANMYADWLTDARMGITSSTTGLPVHCGFQHCFSSMLPAIRNFFTSYKGSIKVVHCIGHSLGGAIASLAADWVTQTLKRPTKLYTFGAPRVGTDWFSKSTTSAIGENNIHRAYHRTDPVPMVPLYPFMQAPYNRNGHYLYSAQPLASGDAHSMGNYIKSVTGKS